MPDGSRPRSSGDHLLDLHAEWEAVFHFEAADGPLAERVEVCEELPDFGPQGKVPERVLGPWPVLAAEFHSTNDAGRRIEQRLAVPDNEVLDDAEVDLLGEFHEALSWW